MSNDLCDCLYAWEIDELFNNLTANIEIIQLFVVDFRRIRLCAAFLQHLLSYSWPFFLHNRLFQSPETIWGHHSQANFPSFCVTSCGDGHGHNYNLFSEAKWARLVIRWWCAVDKYFYRKKIFVLHLFPLSLPCFFILFD